MLENRERQKLLLEEKGVPARGKEKSEEKIEQKQAQATFSPNKNSVKATTENTKRFCKMGGRFRYGERGESGGGEYNEERLNNTEPANGGGIKMGLKTRCG